MSLMICPIYLLLLIIQVLVSLLWVTMPVCLLLIQVLFLFNLVLGCCNSRAFSMLLKCKNLYFVAQFSKDNHVYFEFHSFLRFVKDIETRNVFLVGSVHEGYRHGLIYTTTQGLDLQNFEAIFYVSTRALCVTTTLGKPTKEQVVFFVLKWILCVVTLTLEHENNTK